MIPVPGKSKTPFPKPPTMLQSGAPCGTPRQWPVSRGLTGSLVIAEPVAGPDVALWQTADNTFGHGPMHLYDDPPVPDAPPDYGQLRHPLELRGAGTQSPSTDPRSALNTWRRW